MIKILNKRAEKIPVIPPPSAYNAEITIDDDGKILYIHVCSHLETIYTVGEKSIYNYMVRKDDKLVEVKFLEEYGDIEDAKTSKYAEYFELAENMLGNL